MHRHRRRLGSGGALLARVIEAYPEAKRAGAGAAHDRGGRAAHRPRTLPRRTGWKCWPTCTSCTGTWRPATGRRPGRADHAIELTGKRRPSCTSRSSITSSRTSTSAIAWSATGPGGRWTSRTPHRKRSRWRSRRRSAQVDYRGGDRGRAPRSGADRGDAVTNARPGVRQSGRCRRLSSGRDGGGDRRVRAPSGRRWPGGWHARGAGWPPWSTSSSPGTGVRARAARRGCCAARTATTSNTPASRAARGSCGVSSRTNRARTCSSPAACCGSPIGRMAGKPSRSGR